jgi:predicted RNase H-like nuclease (RuvC/YqgF family)
MGDEWRNEKEHTISTLMIKLENVRDREKLMHDKAKGLEHENLELNYQRQEHDNVVEKLNRRVRDLEDTYLDR